MSLGKNRLRKGRLVAGLGLVLAGTMLTGCLSADRRANTANQQKIVKPISTNNQANANSAGSSNSAGANSNSPNGQNNSAINSAAQNSNSPLANSSNSSPTVRPTGLSTASPNNPVSNNNMNNPPQFGGIQQIGANAPSGNGGLQTIATNNPTHGNGPIQSLNGPPANLGGMPPLDAVPGGNSTPRSLPPAVSMQQNDRMLQFPTTAPLLPGPTFNPGPVVTPGPVGGNIAPSSPGPIGGPGGLGPIAPLPPSGN